MGKLGLRGRRRRARGREWWGGMGRRLLRGVGGRGERGGDTNQHGSEPSCSSREEKRGGKKKAPFLSARNSKKGEKGFKEETRGNPH